MMLYGVCKISLNSSFLNPESFRDSLAKKEKVDSSIVMPLNSLKAGQ